MKCQQWHCWTGTFSLAWVKQWLHCTPSAKGRMEWGRKVGNGFGDIAVPLSQAWGVVIPEGRHRAEAFGEMTPVSGCEFLSEHQLITQVMNPFWDRFRFYCSTWESSQTSVARRSSSSRALAALSLPRGRTRKDAHHGDFHLSTVFPTGFHNRGSENSRMNKTVQERNVLSQRGRENSGHR